MQDAKYQEITSTIISPPAWDNYHCTHPCSRSFRLTLTQPNSCYSTQIKNINDIWVNLRTFVQLIQLPYVSLFPCLVFTYIELAVNSYCWIFFFRDSHSEVRFQLLLVNTNFLCDFVIYLDFHSTKQALWLVDSWSRAPNQTQMYLDRDKIAQLLPARRIQRYVCLFYHMIV